MITEYKNEILKGRPVKIDIDKITIEKNNNQYKITCSMNYYNYKQLIQNEFFELNIDNAKYSVVSSVLSTTTANLFATKKKYKANLYKTSRKKFTDKFFTAVLADDLKKIICSCSLI